MSRHCAASAVTLVLAITACLVAPAAAEEPDQTLSRAVEAETAKTKRVIFVCPKDVLLTVEFVTSEPAQPAIVRLADGAQISLPAKESGSGYRYADDAHELRGKGRDIIWTDGTNPPVVCTEETPHVGGTEPK